MIPNIENQVIHCANSPATLMQPAKPFFDMVRLGRAIHGDLDPNLIPITLRRSRKALNLNLIHVKQLDAGERVGYG